MNRSERFLRAGTFGQHLGLKARRRRSRVERRDSGSPPSFTTASSRGVEEHAAIFSQLLTCGTDIEVAFGIKCEVAAGEGSVRVLGLVD